MTKVNTRGNTEVETYALETFEVETERASDEIGSIIVTIRTDDAEITVNAGRFHDDAVSLRDELLRAAKAIDSQILEGWQDVPDEYDAFVNADRDGYYVTIEGVVWDHDNGKTVSHQGSRRVRPLPTRDIATYELARAMSETGVFPNAWYQDERGYTVNIEEDVRKHHDEGDTGLLPLPGVEYEDDAEVMVDGWRAYVVKDYGDLGLVYVLAGDDTRHFEEDRSKFSPAEDDDEGSQNGDRPYLVFVGEEEWLISPAENTEVRMKDLPLSAQEVIRSDPEIEVR